MRLALVIFPLARNNSDLVLLPALPPSLLPSFSTWLAYHCRELGPGYWNSSLAFDMGSNILQRMCDMYAFSLPPAERSRRFKHRRFIFAHSLR